MQTPAVKKVLITGANGLLARCLISQNYNSWNISATSHRPLDASSPEFDLIKVDFANQRAEVIPLAETLIQDAGIVYAFGKYFDWSQPGVYRLYRLNTISEQRLVGSSDVKILLKYVGYLWLYGDERGDNGRGRTDEFSLSKSIVIGSCGTLAALALQVFLKLNIPAREILCLTFRPWNGQDDGHSLLEVWDNERGWFIYDPSFALSFNVNGILANGRRNVWLCLE